MTSLSISIDLANAVPVGTLIAPMAWLATYSAQVVAVTIVAIAATAMALAFLVFSLAFAFTFLPFLAFALLVALSRLSTTIWKTKPTTFLALGFAFLFPFALLTVLHLVHFHRSWALICRA